MSEEERFSVRDRSNLTVVRTNFETGTLVESLFTFDTYDSEVYPIGVVARPSGDEWESFQITMIGFDYS
jgi:hypothetical protein